MTHRPHFPSFLYPNNIAEEWKSRSSFLCHCKKKKTIYIMTDAPKCHTLNQENNTKFLQCLSVTNFIHWSLQLKTSLQCILIYIHQDATSHSLFYLETALHVSGGISTHHQERKQPYLQHLVFVRPLLPPAAIAAGGSNGLTNSRYSGRWQ